MSIIPSRDFTPNDMTERLAHFTREADLSNVSSEGMETLHWMLLDTFGVALAATHHPIGRIITKHALAIGGGAEATVLGSKTKTGVLAAAQANGALANAIDFDDGNHVVTCVLPAALAMAEKVGASGRAFLEAFAISLEIGTRLKSLIDDKRQDGEGPTRRGWWHVSLTGPIAAAAAAARLLGLDHQQTIMSLGIATSASAGFRRNMGTMTKALHSGNSARAGVEAALLAQQGFTADPQALEGPLGFARAVSAPEQPHWSALDILGEPFFFETRSQAKTKPYPCCTPIQPVLDAVLKLRTEAGSKGDDIASVEADLHRFSLFRTQASDVDAVGFCGAFLVAAALTRGKVGLAETGEEGVNDPDIAAMMKRVTHVKNDPEIVRIHMQDGRRLETRVGSVRRLTTYEEVRAKFDACASLAVAPDHIPPLCEAIMNVAAAPDVSRIVACASGHRA